ncbi:protein kinase [Candidatus Woesearchaeota archaeon]|nr:protein kinase [Candidatus Woesearchaeota archaeon]
MNNFYFVKDYDKMMDRVGREGMFESICCSFLDFYEFIDNIGVSAYDIYEPYDSDIELMIKDINSFNPSFAKKVASRLGKDRNLEWILKTPDKKIMFYSEALQMSNLYHKQINHLERKERSCHNPEEREKIWEEKVDILIDQFDYNPYRFDSEEFKRCKNNLEDVFYGKDIRFLATLYDGGLFSDTKMKKEIINILDQAINDMNPGSSEDILNCLYRYRIMRKIQELDEGIYERFLKKMEHDNKRTDNEVHIPFLLDSMPQMEDDNKYTNYSVRHLHNLPHLLVRLAKGENLQSFYDKKLTLKVAKSGLAVNQTEEEVTNDLIKLEHRMRFYRDYDFKERYKRIFNERKCSNLSDILDCASIKIPDSEVICKLGKGCFGTTYKIRNKNVSNIEGTIKIQNEGSEDILKDEAKIQTLKGMAHNNIVKILDYQSIEYSGKKCKAIRMEYVEGRSLRDIIDKSKLNAKTAVNYTLQILEGLKFLHSQDIYHRDLKPENIMVTKDGTVKLIDFGLASSNEVSDRPMMNRLYGAPEFKINEEHANSDIWSLGLIFYEMLTGEYLIKPSENNIYDSMTKFKEYVTGKEKMWIEVQKEMDEKIKDRIYSVRDIIPSKDNVFEKENSYAVQFLEKSLQVDSNLRYFSAADAMKTMKAAKSTFEYDKPYDPIKTKLKMNSGITYTGILDKYKKLSLDEKKLFRRFIDQIDENEKKGELE